MKSLIKKLSLGLTIIMILGVAFGCNQDKGPKSKVDVYTNVGFIDDIITDDGKNYIEIGVNANSLRLEVLDNNVFNNIEENEFYKFAYDENNILLSIEKDIYLEDLVKQSMKEDNDPEGTTHIQTTDKQATEDLVLLDSYSFDINDDGFEETISIYVDAEKGANGEVYWDDGQKWLFLVEGRNEDYVLFDDFIQIGSLNYHIYTEDDDFYITTIQSGTANLDIVEYKFDPDSNGFISTSKYGTTGNVNMLHSTSGY